MTTELIIANRNCIVMAADSVVTTKNGKTYTGVDKLFPLSNKPPMGIMVFGSANFEGVPMETLIKEFREEFDFSENPDIEKIKDGFIEFMANNTPKTDIKRLISQKISDFKHNNQNKTKLDISSKQELPKYLSEIKELNMIDSDLKELIPDNLSESEKIERFYNLKENFLKFLISDSSGIVIAGFNKKSHFPSCICLEASFNYNGKIKVNKEKSLIDFKGSFILPIAQKDVIITFITGIDENMEDRVITSMNRVITNYSNKLKIELNKNLNIDKISLKKFNKEIDKINENYNEYNVEFINDLYKLKDENLKPILDSIDSLPTDELSKMAELLINITSLKRKITPVIESVGGFVDVAIITKGDGFIWKKK